MRRQGNVINDYRDQLQQQASEAAATAERNRLARDLHDSIKQQIFSIRMSALVAQAQIEQNVAKAQEALADIQQSATEAQVEMQALLQQLRSTALEHTSFAEAVRTQAQALEYRSGAHVQLELADLPPLDRCPLLMQEAVFRIVQEALANIARHARASQVECRITHNDELLNVSIRDDGQGFELQEARNGMGLANIQERAHSLHGSAEIESAPGNGTSIHVRIPLFLPAEVQQERERREQEERALATSAGAGLQLRSTTAIFTLLVLLIDIAQFTTNAPANRKELALFMLGFCLFFMFYGLVSAHVALARLRMRRGAQDREYRSLLLQERIGWAASLRLALFASWHIVAWIWRLFLNTENWKAEGCILLIAVLALVLMLFVQYQLKEAQDSYYHLLSGRALKLAVAQRWSKLRLRIILTLCITMSLFVNGFTLFFLPVLLWQWLAYSFFFAFVIQLLSIVIDAWLLHPWRKLARAVTRG
jgi:histidine kinase/histidine kinase/DNA gyrase B/HSP90-like ATPase